MSVRTIPRRPSAPPGSAGDRRSTHAERSARTRNALLESAARELSRYGYGNVLKIRPPLILTMDQAEEICDKLENLFLAELAR